MTIKFHTFLTFALSASAMPSVSLAVDNGHGARTVKVDDKDVVIEDSVKFEDHFKSSKSVAKPSTISDSAAAVRAPLAVSALGYTGAAVLDQAMRQRAGRVGKKIASLDGDDAIDADKLLRNPKLRFSRKVFAASGLWFLADAATGMVITMNGHEPVHYANLPALAAYLLRESKEGVNNTINTNGANLTSLAEPVAKDLEKITSDLSTSVQERVASGSNEIMNSAKQTTEDLSRRARESELARKVASGSKQIMESSQQITENIRRGVSGTQQEEPKEKEDEPKK